MLHHKEVRSYFTCQEVVRYEHEFSARGTLFQGTARLLLPKLQTCTVTNIVSRLVNLYSISRMISSNLQPYISGPWLSKPVCSCSVISLAGKGKICPSYSISFVPISVEHSSLTLPFDLKLKALIYKILKVSKSLCN